MIRRTLTVLLLSILQAYSAASLAANDPATTADLDELFAMLSGDFDNYLQMQFKASDEQAVSKTNHYERMSITTKPVLSDQLPGHWLFAQTNKTDDNNQVYRQTVLEFFVNDDGAIRSRVWRIADPAAKKSKTPGEAFLNQLSRDDLAQVLPDSCLTQWVKQGDHFVGTIAAESCVIQSKYKDEKRKLFSEEIVFDAGYWTREGAYDADGKLIFGLDEGHYYRFQKNAKAED